MFDAAADLYWSKNTELPTIRTTEKLLRIQGIVNPDGNTATFAVIFTNNRPFIWEAGIEDIALPFHEIRSAALQMMDMQAMKYDQGRHKLLEVAAHALRPTDMQVVIDRWSGDRVFIFQFNDHAPLAIRRSPAEILQARALLALAEAESLN